ncbi:MAG: hypothetical protein WCT10_03520 [Patescibacteria group bacterium]|jgi:hypothetical protein
MANNKQYSATIVRDKKGAYHIRISNKGPQTGGDVEVIEILYGDASDELGKRAVKFIKGYRP